MGSTLLLKVCSRSPKFAGNTIEVWASVQQCCGEYLCTRFFHAHGQLPLSHFTIGYGAEVRWEVSQLGLLAGHTYRMYFMVHDGDQNKAGGDAGQGCAILGVGP